LEKNVNGGNYGILLFYDFSSFSSARMDKSRLAVWSESSLCGGDSAGSGTPLAGVGMKRGVIHLTTKDESHPSLFDTK